MSVHSNTPAKASSILHAALSNLGAYGAASKVYLFFSPASVALAAKRAALICGFIPVLQAPSRAGGAWVMFLFVAHVSKPVAPVQHGMVLGFSGCRRLSPSSASQASLVLASAVTQPSWSGFAVGCCPTGLDSVIRNSSFAGKGKLSIFNAASRHPRHLVARSVRVASSVGALVCFPEVVCPGGLVPSASSAKCFCGKGSGTWATAAHAAGLGAVVYVAGIMPSALPVSWGKWVRSARLPGCWRLVPVANSQQLNLF